MLRKRLAIAACTLLICGAEGGRAEVQPIGNLAANVHNAAASGESTAPSGAPAAVPAGAAVDQVAQGVSTQTVRGGRLKSLAAKQRGTLMRIRRVVTGHTADGKSEVIKDDVVKGLPVAGGDAEFAIVWKTVKSPVDNDDANDRSAEPTALVEPNGSILRMVDLAPHTRSPMHRTDSLDYGIVLKGEVDIELDGGKLTRIRQGDVIVQRGTIHAWVNHGSATCRIAFILLGANPATVNGRPLPSVMGDISPDK
jgi:quercetin dioxygenase-like cupin family protein